VIFLLTDLEVGVLVLVPFMVGLAIGLVVARRAQSVSTAPVEPATPGMPASDALGESLDLDQTLKALASVAVPAIADWYAIHLLEDGHLRRAFVFPGVPAEEPPDDEDAKEVEETAGLQRVLQSCRPLLLPDLEQAEDSQVALELQEIAADRELSSALVAPLMAHGRSIGVLSLAYVESGRRYGEADRHSVEALATRAAMALNNALRFKEAQQTEEELRYANEAKDEFLGFVAHELRTPITTIYGGARFLNTRAGFLDEDAKKELLQAVEEDAEKLNRLIDNLLALARMELGREVPKEPLQIAHFMDNVAQAFRRRRPGRELIIRNNATRSVVLAGPTYLEQVLSNLLDNADKYTQVGPPLEIEISSTEDEIIIRVLDRGPGLRPEELGRIFESFYRSEHTAQRAPGKGLGLAVCKRLIEAHGGRIWAVPRPEGGLEVGFSLPAAADDEDSI
jgi:signal transduction histidine kinase